MSTHARSTALPHVPQGVDAMSMHARSTALPHVPQRLSSADAAASLNGGEERLDAKRRKAGGVGGGRTGGDGEAATAGAHGLSSNTSSHATMGGAKDGSAYLCESPQRPRMSPQRPRMSNVAAAHAHNPEHGGGGRSYSSPSSASSSATATGAPFKGAATASGDQQFLLRVRHRRRRLLTPEDRPVRADADLSLRIQQFLREGAAAAGVGRAGAARHDDATQRSIARFNNIVKKSEGTDNVTATTLRCLDVVRLAVAQDWTMMGGVIRDLLIAMSDSDATADLPASVKDRAATPSDIDMYRETPGRAIGPEKLLEEAKALQQELCKLVDSPGAAHWKNCVVGDAKAARGPMRECRVQIKIQVPNGAPLELDLIDRAADAIRDTSIPWIDASSLRVDGQGLRLWTGDGLPVVGAAAGASTLDATVERILRGTALLMPTNECTDAWRKDGKVCAYGLHHVLRYVGKGWKVCEFDG